MSVELQLYKNGLFLVEFQPPSYLKPFVWLVFLSHTAVRWLSALGLRAETGATNCKKLKPQTLSYKYQRSRLEVRTLTHTFETAI